MKKKIVDSILLSLLFTAITAGLAMFFTDTKSPWYLSLVKPAIQPPPWVFIAAWTVVYLLFAASLALTMIHGGETTDYILYGLQIACNILWCLFFFRLHLMYVGFGIIVVYLTVTYLFIRKRIRSWPGWLLIPQGLWLVLAGIINYLTILLN